MCKCTPEIKTPFCGKGDCVWPETNMKTLISFELVRIGKRSYFIIDKEKFEMVDSSDPDTYLFKEKI